MFYPNLLGLKAHYAARNQNHTRQWPLFTDHHCHNVRRGIILNITTKNFQYNESQARSEVSLLPYAITMILFSALPHLVFAQEPPPGIGRECGEHSAPAIHEGFLPPGGAFPPSAACARDGHAAPTFAVACRPD